MLSAGEPPFASLLVANRGEIAVRIIRACAALGIRSVAVYSEADRDALHVRLADEAHLIGPAPASESYLSIPRILGVARRTGAPAIHPGYGFLSEQAAFADACIAAGLVFVGPTPGAMRLLGDKAAARRLAARAGVPTVPGYDGAAQDDEALATEAARIGYPLLVKAAAGGGGRGMRVARAPVDLLQALAGARREALAAFGDGSLLLEQLLSPVRHVEVQVLGDHYGGLVHLGERDCSVQRRHQKVVEESPAHGLSPTVRAALGESALRIAREAGYTNAGTCEFLVSDAEQFWFIEMNARLQVEHPVTEAVTEIDLVRAQIEIAAGRPLRWRQEGIILRGHAIECRLYAEDPERDNLPATGVVGRFRSPAGPGLRHDFGYADGDEVSSFYDTMLGKLIASGPDRETAIARALAALDRYEIDGVPTNRRLLTAILNDAVFRAGGATTEFLASLPTRPPACESAPPEALAAAVAWDLADVVSDGPGHDDPHRQQGVRGGWAIAGQGIIGHWLAGPDALPQAVIADQEDRMRWLVRIGGASLLVTVADARNGEVLVRLADQDGAATSARAMCYRLTRGTNDVLIDADGGRWVVRRAAPPSPDARPGAGDATADSSIFAPLPGRVVAVLAAEGDHVADRQPLVVVEAMKIESTLVAPRAGTVHAVRCAPGEAVAGGQVLVELAVP